MSPARRAAAVAVLSRGIIVLYLDLRGRDRR